MVLLIGTYFLITALPSGSIEMCGDGTESGFCSKIPPYYCNNGNLIKNASNCGCPENTSINGKDCSSEFKTFPREISLYYVLDKERKNLSFTVYKGVYDYLSKNISRIQTYSEENKFKQGDINLYVINNKFQKSFLLPLVSQIQNLTSDKTDQARIAISLVQNIPYKETDKKTNFTLGTWNISSTYLRYPYEVLYENQGICEEKSNLLVFLLKEMGYETSIIYYPQERHKSVGIKCPLEHSLNNTGYCFIETTGPSILSSEEIPYSTIGNLNSEFKIFNMSSGISLPEKIKEYKDADKFDKILKSANKNGLNVFEKDSLTKLKQEYFMEF